MKYLKIFALNLVLASYALADNASSTMTKLDESGVNLVKVLVFAVAVIIAVVLAAVVKAMSVNIFQAVMQKNMEFSNVGFSIIMPLIYFFAGFALIRGVSPNQLGVVLDAAVTKSTSWFAKANQSGGGTGEASMGG